jgi:ubiquinone/menaquinone biosynthesis C-methylase UbiE
VDYIINSDIKSVLEIGAGEVTEGQHIVAKCDVNYTVLDVSDTFLDNARKLGFRCIKAEMHNTGCKNKEFDIVHLSAVLEHTPDVFATVKELRRISNQFYITLFKKCFKKEFKVLNFVPFSKV